MAEAKQIQYLPPGWFWVGQGQESWTTSEGKESVAKHARHILSGDTLSVRQVQNIQKGKRAALGEEIAPSIPREGKTKTTRKAESDIHGAEKTEAFRSLLDAQLWVHTHDKEPFTKIQIQLRFLKSAIPGKLYPEKRVEGEIISYGNFASLTHFFDLLNPTDIDRGFNLAYNNSQNFITDERSRYYVRYIER